MATLITRICSLRNRRPAVGLGDVASGSRGAAPVYLVTVGVDEAVEGVFSDAEKARDFAEHLRTEHVGLGTGIRIRAHALDPDCSHVRWSLRRYCSASEDRNVA